jgi:hypothetical protein
MHRVNGECEADEWDGLAFQSKFATALVNSRRMIGPIQNVSY